MKRLLDKIINRVFRKQMIAAEQLPPEQEVLLHTVEEYTRIIGQHMPYFNRLTDAGKKKFITRTWHFRQSKAFHFIGMPEQVEIPVLVSGAAVQLTFGLSKYRLNFFRNIFIMPDAYQDNKQGPLFIGHVSPGAIYLSWKHFVQGYADGADNVNVAIHEMAHAVAYDNFFDITGVDHEFRSDFARLPEVFGPEMAALVVNRRHYLRPYAYTNIQEFWAVSVEAFFENPCGLKDNMPRLYSVIAEILNQDLQAIYRINTTV